MDDCCQRNKILLSGYYGFDNAGDEAVLAALIQGLRNALPEAPIVVLSGNVERTKEMHKVDAIDRYDRKLIKSELEKCALFISGGGSLLQDRTSVGSVVYYTDIINLAARHGAQVMIMAQGLGPLDNWISRRFAAHSLKKAAALTWRDDESFELAAKLGVPKNKMQVTCDPVLCWEPELPEKPIKSDEKTAVLCIRHWEGLDYHILAEGADALIEDGYKVQFAPYHSKEDTKCAENIIKLMKCSGAVLLADQTAEQAWQTIGSADLVVGMRLHSLIMAAAQGVSAVAISYDPKIDVFAKTADLRIIGKANRLTDDFVEELRRGGDVPSEEQFDYWRQASAINFYEAATLYHRVVDK